jgi:hypothetical protein
VAPRPSAQFQPTVLFNGCMLKETPIRCFINSSVNGYHSLLERDATTHTCTLLHPTNLQLSFWESAELRWVSNRRYHCTKSFSSVDQRPFDPATMSSREPTKNTHTHTHKETEGTGGGVTAEPAGRIIPRPRTLRDYKDREEDRGRRIKGRGRYCALVPAHTLPWRTGL